ISLIWLVLATVAAMVVLLLATMPRLRPWRSETVPRHGAVRVGQLRSDEPESATSDAAAALRGAAPDAGLPGQGAARGAGLDGGPGRGARARGGARAGGPRVHPRRRPVRP